MIRVICPSCQSKLDAKPELVGQTRRCPKCRNPLVIREATDGGPAAEVAPAHTGATDDEPVAATHAGARPERLVPSYHYLILGRDKLLAVWKNDGQAWQVKSGTGFVSAKRNPDKLPNQGNYSLVELRITAGEQGHRLVGIAAFRLAERWALPTLAQGEAVILEKVTGPGPLNREQKNSLIVYLRERFMAEVWHEYPEIVEYLTNADFHSTTVGR